VHPQTSEGPKITKPLPRIEITEDQIDAVVRRFYARIRLHPQLGPIFNDSISTDPALWQTHEAKIGRFWRNALLRQPVYSGNPMLVHAGISDVQPEHFAVWLGVFDTVLTETLPTAAAASWSRLAHRVGRGLSLGLETARNRASGVPDLSL